VTLRTVYISRSALKSGGLILDSPVTDTEEGSSTSVTEEEIPPSTLGSGGVYRIDKFNKQI
jgi:hypothetical protein